MFAKLILGTIIFSLYLFIFFLPASAQVVINEIFPNPEGDDKLGEFVELYNASLESVSLSGYKIKDKTKVFIISEATISAQDFLSFTYDQTKISINNSDEEIYFLSPSDEILDSYIYGSSFEGKTLCRYPDGAGSFTSQCLPTLSDSNSLPPTVTPTPTNSPTPTKTPTPIPTIKPTSSPTPTKAPTNTQTPTPTGRKPEGEVLSASDSATEIPTNSPSTTGSVPEVPEEGEDKKEPDSASSKNNLNLFIGLGLITAGGSLYGFKKYKENKLK
jgi:hypothetical protein